MCGTFLHANSTVKRQVSLKVHGVYIFTTSVPVVDFKIKFVAVYFIYFV